MKKIAIIGSSSNVGKHLTSFLEKNNSYEIIKIARKNSDLNINLLDSLDDIELPQGLDTVVIVAASMNQKTDDEIITMVETNAVGPLKMCMAAKKASAKKVILISSIFTKIDNNSSYYNYYGISKKNGESLVQYYCKKNGIDLCVLRPSQIYGTDKAFSKYQQLLYLILENVKNNKDVVIYGIHDPIRNFIHIDDVVDVIYRVIEMNINGEIDVVGMNVTIGEIARIAISCCDSKSRILFDGEKQDLEDNGFIFDNQLTELLQKKSFVSLQEGIEKIYEEW